jgi:PEP-CTERM motif
MITLRLHSVALCAGLAALALASSAQAANVTIVNGNFTQGVTSSSEFGTAYPTVQVTGWTTGGYNFVFTPGTADTTGAAGQFGNVALWGPGNGSANGLPATDPNGGNYVAADGAFNVGAISQTLNGLTVGSPTTISFYFAGVQQFGFDGDTTEQFDVSLGSQTLDTSVLSVVSHGFSGWQQESLVFTPTSTSEVLSFLAVGTPSGVPPMSLLADVTGSNTVSTTPEPGSFMLLGTGIAGISGLVRSRLRKSKAAK